MKILSKFFLVVGLLLCFFLANSCLAAPQAEYEANYDFTKIKKILVLPPSVEQSFLSEVQKRELEKILLENSRFKKAELLFWPDLLLTEPGFEREKVSEREAQALKKAFFKALPVTIDAVLFTNILSYRQSTQYMPAKTYTQPVYHKTRYYDHAKKQWKERSYPAYNQYHRVPAYNAVRLSVSVQFSLVETENCQRIFSYTQERSKVLAEGKVETPGKLYARIIKDFFSQLQKHF